MPFSQLVLGEIENKTMYGDFEEKFYYSIFNIFPSYGNIKIVKNPLKDSLNIDIKEYIRNPYEYDENGNIRMYRYFLKVEYNTGGIDEMINSDKIFSSEISEDMCKDSLIIFNIKDFLDRIRKEF